MNVIRRPRMTADEFIIWAMDQPETERYELVQGEVVGMSPERSQHVLMKFAVARRLAEAVETAGLACTVYPDGMSVRIDDATTYVPDALVHCGPPVAADAVELCDPVIVVEVLSPSTQGIDTNQKLFDYFRLASVRHYLIVRPSDGRVVHHWRGEDGGINTRIHAGGPLTLDPPGITIAGLAGAPG